MYSPVRGGGLGVCNLRVFNKALSRKWLWRYNYQREALWNVVIDTKYGSIRGVGALMKLGGTWSEVMETYPKRLGVLL